MRVLGLSGLLAVGACTGPSGDAPVDTDTDLPVDTDDSEPVGPPDTGLPAETDASDDTDLPGETDTADTGVGCPYVALDEVMAVCDAQPRVVSYLDAAGAPGCPSVWTVDGLTGTLDDVLDAASCDRACVYDPAVGVTALVCGVRGGYIRWESGALGQIGAGESCPAWLEIDSVVGSDWTTGSWEDWLAAHPCP